MPGRSVLVELPDDLYDRLQRRAADAQRSLGDEVIDMLRASDPDAGDALPEDLKREVARLETLDDARLWKMARRSASPRTARRLESLNSKGQRQRLNRAERRVASQLADELDRRMLLRARILLLLKQRGYDVDTFMFGR